jgi:hypothetical protein
MSFSPGIARRGQPTDRCAEIPADSVYAANYGQFEDKQAIAIYDKMLRETDFSTAALMLISRGTCSIPRPRDIPAGGSGWCPTGRM